MFDYTRLRIVGAPTNAASLHAAGLGRLTVGFKLIMADEATVRPLQFQRDSAPSKIIPLTYGLAMAAQRTPAGLQSVTCLTAAPLSHFLSQLSILGFTPQRTIARAG